MRVFINPEFQTLFPEEIDTYEPYVIREAINNAIAHQDYRLGGQINVVEYNEKLVFSNKGSFTYSKHKGLDIKACEELLLGSLRDHKTLSKPEVAELLWNVLPDVFSDAQKQTRINNLLSKLRIQGKIYCISKGKLSNWYIKEQN